MPAAEPINGETWLEMREDRITDQDVERVADFLVEESHSVPVDREGFDEQARQLLKHVLGDGEPS